MAEDTGIMVASDNILDKHLNGVKELVGQMQLK